MLSGGRRLEKGGQQGWGLEGSAWHGGGCPMSGGTARFNICC